MNKKVSKTCSTTKAPPYYVCRAMALNAIYFIGIAILYTAMYTIITKANCSNIINHSHNSASDVPGWPLGLNVNTTTNINSMN